MKKIQLITVIIFLFCFNSNAQIKATTTDGKEVILNSNGTWKYSNNEFSNEKINIPDFTADTFNWKDGYDKIVTVNFMNVMPGDKTMDKEIFDEIFTQSMVKAKYSLKNKLSFVPRELVIMKKDDKYTTKVTYLGKNAYGAESELSTIFVFDLKGNFEKSF